jgi:hypothetical protein
LETYARGDKDQKDSTHGIANSKRRNEEEPPTVEFIQEWLDKMTAPLKFEASNLIWSAHFRINERIANGFRKKRAFLIGGNLFSGHFFIFVYSTKIAYFY